MMRSRTTAFAAAVLAALVAGCNEDSTGACRAVVAGRVATAAGEGVVNATVSLRDTVTVTGVPILTATTNAAGEFGAVLNGDCLTCGATVIPPAQYQLPAGAPARVPAALACNQTLALNFTLQRSGDVVD